MPRTKSRARHRRARADTERAHVASAIEALLERIGRPTTTEERIAANADLVALLKRIAGSDRLRLWPFFDQCFGPRAGGKVRPADVDEAKALIAQLVAPHLAGRPTGRVRHRKSSAVSSLRSL